MKNFYPRRPRPQQTQLSPDEWEKKQNDFLDANANDYVALQEFGNRMNKLMNDCMMDGSMGTYARAERLQKRAHELREKTDRAKVVRDLYHTEDN